MQPKRIKKEQLLNELTPEWPVDLMPTIRAQVEAGGRKVVVLDDDPTGTQTVHGIPVLTKWSVASLKAELVNDLPVFYLLTNSRALPALAAQTLYAEIGSNLEQASRQTGRQYVAVSRSDSTLRGHFPGEVDSLAEAIGQPYDTWITLIIPFFLEGGRYTINDVHYVAEDEWFTPAGQTEFARDKAFGFKSSNLRDWVAEKMHGRVSAQDVASISIEDIRRGGPAQVTKKLTNLPTGSICVVNAVAYRDLEVFVCGLLAAEAQGSRFLYRSAASFAKIRAGLDSRPLLSQADLMLPEDGGGLIVVGSYVPKTTQQVQELLADRELSAVEINVASLLDSEDRQNEIDRQSTKANIALQNKKDVLIYTSRTLISGNNAEGSLAVGRKISTGLMAIIRAISTRPRYLLAKGGITASDVATKGLNISRAQVLGQIIPGVPVWQAGDESRWPGLALIVFPGNVGGPQALAEVVHNLQPDG